MWDEMKKSQWKKIIPSSYGAWFLEELFYLFQGDLSITEYKLKFEELVFRYGFQIVVVLLYLCIIKVWDL